MNSNEPIHDPRTRLMPKGPILSIAPHVVVETAGDRLPTEPVVTLRFGVSWS